MSVNKEIRARLNYKKKPIKKNHKPITRRKKVGIILGSIFGGLVLAFGGTIGIIALVTYIKGEQNKKKDPVIHWQTYFNHVNTEPHEEIGEIYTQFVDPSVSDGGFHIINEANTLFTINEKSGILSVGSEPLQANTSYQFEVEWVPYSDEVYNYAKTNIEVLTAPQEATQTKITWRTPSVFLDIPVAASSEIGLVYNDVAGTDPAPNTGSWQLSGPSADNFAIINGNLSVGDTPLIASSTYEITVTWAPGNMYTTEVSSFTLKTIDTSYDVYSFSNAMPSTDYGYAGALDGGILKNWSIKIDTSSTPSEETSGQVGGPLLQFTGFYIWIGFVSDEMTDMSARPGASGGDDHYFYSSTAWDTTSGSNSWLRWTYDGTKYLTLTILAEESASIIRGYMANQCNSCEWFAGIDNICLLPPQS